MPIHVKSLGNLNLSKGFFAFTWLDAPVFDPVVGVQDTPSWLDPDIFGDIGAGGDSAPPVTRVDTLLGPVTPPADGAPAVTDRPPVEIDATVLPDAPVVEVRWTDPFFDADIRAGGHSRFEPVEIITPDDQGVWISAWNFASAGLGQVYVLPGDSY